MTTPKELPPTTQYTFDRGVFAATLRCPNGEDRTVFLQMASIAAIQLIPHNPVTSDPTKINGQLLLVDGQWYGINMPNLHPNLTDAWRRTG